MSKIVARVTTGSGNVFDIKVEPLYVVGWLSRIFGHDEHRYLSVELRKGDRVAIVRQDYHENLSYMFPPGVFVLFKGPITEELVRAYWEI
jgi:hypothetical protein